MDLTKILGGIETVLPILAGLTGHPEVGILGQRLMTLAEEEIARRQGESGKSRSEVLAEAAATWEAAKAANDELKAAGH